MSRTATKKIRVGVFAESQLIADSLLHMMQKESDLACLKMNNFFMRWPNQPELIVLDWQDATDSNLKELRLNLPHAKIVVMNGDATGLDLVLCSRVGVTGFTLKASSSSEIAETIRSAAAGAQIIPARIGARLFNEIHEAQNSNRVVFGDAALTPREQDIAHLVAEGLRNKEVAAKLSIGVETVKTHIRSVLRKLGLRNRVELVKRLLFDKPA